MRYRLLPALTLALLTGGCGSGSHPEAPPNLQASPEPQPSAEVGQPVPEGGDEHSAPDPSSSAGASDEPGSPGRGRPGGGMVQGGGMEEQSPSGASGPRVRMAMGRISVDGPLSEDSARRVIGGHRSEAIECAEQHPGTGRLRFTLQLSDAGGVQLVAGGESDLPPELTACIHGVAGGWPFPASDSQVTLSFMFMTEP